MYQLPLLFSHNKDTLKKYLEKETGKNVSLTLTDNSNRILSVKTKRKAVFVRMHWMFLHAGNDVVKEIGEFINRKKDRTPYIRRFIRENNKCLKSKSFKAIRGCAQGSYYNLYEIFSFLNNNYFESRISASIIWGKKSPRRSVRKVTLGSYSNHSNTIRINPVLDRKTVPGYFIKFIIYHEMLHADMSEERKNGRSSVHSAEFKKRERLFKDYEKAFRWEKIHLI
jgi:hypothetical protein